MTKNLITGVGGFVGSHLAEYLIEQGEEVWGTARWNEDLARLKGLDTKANIVAMELNDLSSCIRVLENIKPDYIFHLGAQSYVSESFDYPISTIQTNIIGTLNLLEAIRVLKIDPIVHICSSSEVYGMVKKEDVPIRETQGFNPANPYAVGKVGTDMLALMYWNNYKIRTIRTRMFTHTGPGRTMLSAECNFARQIALIEKGLQEPVLRHGNLNSIRTWADVRDAVRAYYLLVKKCKVGDVYNIGGTEQRTIGEMLTTLLSLSSSKIELVQDPKLMRPYDVTLQIPDCSKFISETDWSPQYDFETTMKDVLNFWRNTVTNR